MKKKSETTDSVRLGLPCWYCGEIMPVTVCKNGKGYHYVCDCCKVRGFFYEQHFRKLDEAAKFVPLKTG